MKTSFSVVFVLLTTLIFGQSHDAVMRPVYQLFDGMLKSDSSMVRRAFTEDAKMITTYKNKELEEEVHNGSLDSFVKTVGSKKEGTPDWVEKIRDPQISVDGSVAQVWTEYSFYIGDKFSHCGVDAFQLVKKNGEWKIAHLMDTRRTQSCEQRK